MGVRFALSKHKNPPIPVIALDLVTPDGSLSLSGVAAIVDTAADRTVIPLGFLHQLKLRPVGQIRVQGFGTAQFVVDIYELRVVIPNVCDVTVRAIEHANELHILLGRDVLNQFSFTFDGPNQFIEFM
jgi:predicted aspartyl protease